MTPPRRCWNRRRSPVCGTWTCRGWAYRRACGEHCTPVSECCVASAIGVCLRRRAVVLAAEVAELRHGMWFSIEAEDQHGYFHHLFVIEGVAVHAVLAEAFAVIGTQH